MNGDTESYLEEIISSVLFLSKIDKKAKKGMASPDDIRIMYHERHSYRKTALALEEVRCIEQEVSRALEIFPFEMVQSRCHAVSNAMLINLHRKFGDKIGIVALTIGDVSYGGEKFFGTSKQYIKRVIAGGDRDKSLLNLHAWLTLSDLTIVDPTISVSTTLARLSNIEVPKTAKVLVGRQGDFGGLRYHPMLVDNFFIQRIGEDQ